MSLRRRLCGGILVDSPSLLVHARELIEIEMDQTAWENQARSLVFEALGLLNDLQTFTKVDFESQFLPCESSSEAIVRSRNTYPDLVLGVLDSVAHAAMLPAQKILRYIYYKAQQIYPQSELLSEIEPVLKLIDFEIIGQWRQRAVAALEFVQGESTLAAKPLEFGIQQLRRSNATLVAFASPR